MYLMDGRIRYSETDNCGKLTLLGLLNYFQDCSTFHSEDIGLGVDYLRQTHTVWVLSAWQIVVERYPAMGEKVRIGTCPYNFKGFTGSRNFVMLTEDGECLAKANSLWSLLDTGRGKPTLPTKEMLEGYILEEPIEMDYAPRKITVPEGGENRESIIVRKHHLDTNNHVNNGQYVEMAMEYLPERFAIRQMRAEYKRQAFLNDIISVYTVQIENRYVVALNDEEGKPYVVVEFTGQ